MANLVQGKVFQVGVDDNRLTCQMDATLSLSQEFETEEACKPDYASGSVADGVSWQQQTAGDKSWEITGSGKVEDSFTHTTALALDQHMIESDDPIEVTFGTVDSTGAVITYSGSAYISSFTINAPTSGAATYDYTFTGNGAITRVVTPVPGA